MHASISQNIYLVLLFRHHVEQYLLHVLQSLVPRFHPHIGE